jgi:leader peptidase (prepilin peptidase)/N-methyltransferase
VLSPAAFAAVAALFGAIVGSFLNVVIHRLPRGESVAFPPSRCPLCGARIRPLDNVPVLSWVLLRGRCRACGGAFGARYAAVELANALLWAALATRSGPGLAFAADAALVSALLAVTMIDLDHLIIPDAITLPGIPAGLVASAFRAPDPSALAGALHDRLGLGRLPGALGSPGLWDALLAAAAGFCFFWAAAEIGYRVFRKESMGGGDIKLAAMMGAFLGLSGLVVAIYVALLAGSLVGIALLVLRRAKVGTAIPFGPFLALGGVTAVFFADRVVEWYLRLSGS